MSHRHTAPGQHEHEFEPAHGLPEPLPPGEHLVWQGHPDWRHLARRAFHLRKIAVYFALLLAVRGVDGWMNGESAGSLARHLGGFGLLASVALVVIASLAWLAARTTVYTVTDQRVVMRIGIVLSLSLNLPHSRIVAADLRRDGQGPGDIVLRLAPESKIAYLHLWPHARPWRLARPEPMLRSLPDAAHAAVLLARAWSEATGVALQADTAAAPVADRPLAPAGARSAAPAGRRSEADASWVNTSTA